MSVENAIHEKITNEQTLWEYIMNTANDFQERRARTKREIKQLIQDRNRVLGQFYNLVNCANDATDCKESVNEMLQEFCQELVDYLATGHFEIYRRIEDGEERRSDIRDLAQRIFNRISDTTAVAVEFNDLYDEKQGDPEQAIKNLPTHLSRLGESLAERIDLEDQFINSLLRNPEKPALHAI